MAEVFPTLRAFIWLLSRMGPLVSGQDRSLTEASPALQTLVWLLSCMGLLVSDKAGPLREAFPAISTFVLLISRVALSQLLFCGINGKSQCENRQRKWRQTNSGYGVITYFLLSAV